MIDLWGVQVAIYGKLTATPGTYPVYDAVPQGAAFPYIVLGPINAIPDDELEAASVDASFTIDGWSRSAGKIQAHAILEFIRDRLDNVNIGAGAWACSEESADVMEDRTSTAASRLYHAIARYRLRAN